MKVISVNLGVRKTIVWRGKNVETGIFKSPVNNPITLEATDVVSDTVIDRKYHGGIDKACYVYSADHYPYWQELYPDLDWKPGMFGENITIEGLDETQIYLGDIYQLGTAQVEVSQPREPCFKLGVRFGTQKVLKQFINAPYPGVYLRVLVSGEVKTGNTLTLIKSGNKSASLAEVYRVAHHSNKADEPTINAVLKIDNLPADLRENLQKRLRLHKA